MMVTLGLGLLFMLLVLVVGALVLTVIALAITKKSPGIAAFVGGLVLLGLLLTTSAILLYFYTAQSVPHVLIPDPVEVGNAWTHVPPLNPDPPNAPVEYVGRHTNVNRFHERDSRLLGTRVEYAGGHTNVRWGISIFGLLLIPSVMIALAVAIISRMRSNKPSGERGNWWPALLIIPLIGLFFLGGLRVQKTSHHAPRVEALHQDIARQRLHAQAQMSRGVAEMNAQIANMNIHELMDKADAPRIALAPDVPTATDAPEESASKDNNAATETDAVAESEATDAVELAAQVGAAVESEIANQKEESSEADSVGVDADAKSNDSAKSDDRSRGRPGSRRERGESPNKESAAPRPDWVNDPPKRVGNTWREVVATDQYATIEECHRAADVYLLIATYNHLMELNGRVEIADRSLPNITFHRNQVLADGRLIISDGHAFDERLSHLTRLGIGIDFVRRDIAKEEYVETVDRSVGPMKKLYTLIEFSPVVDRELRQRWEAYRRQERFAVVGVGAASVLGLLGVAWGLLKIDTVTKGYYTKRLLIGGTTGIVAALLFLWFINVT